MILEYLWLDGNDPEQIRSKIKVDPNFDGDEVPPKWSYDGSSTNQAEGNDSDLPLIPVRIFEDTRDPDGARGNYRWDWPRAAIRPKLQWKREK